MSGAQTQDSYTIRDLADEVRRQMAVHGSDGPKLLEALRAPLTRILASDLSNVGVKREGNHIDESRYLYYDGEMSITFDHLPKDKDIPPHDHGIWEGYGDLQRATAAHGLRPQGRRQSARGYAELEGHRRPGARAPGHGHRRAAGGDPQLHRADRRHLVGDRGRRGATRTTAPTTTRTTTPMSGAIPSAKRSSSGVSSPSPARAPRP